ncbi:CLUMA_CG006944, isoform A [Clunio marinus]|uniref:CLUMA_CG006944, isoform A n=1 Tax=Clunio marinus TaxID=568069 RepID=A0A1J1HZ79_9DIPT|nr:CLUMA_CG006944, isoform A [Clunio marinus]
MKSLHETMRMTSPGHRGDNPERNILIQTLRQEILISTEKKEENERMTLKLFLYFFRFPSLSSYNKHTRFISMNDGVEKEEKEETRTPSDKYLLQFRLRGFTMQTQKSCSDCDKRRSKLRCFIHALLIEL